MTSSAVEMAAKLRQTREEIDALVCQGANARRAERAAEILRSFWPGAALYACVLPGEGQAAALDDMGRPRPEWAETIRAAAVSPPLPEAFPLPDRLLAWEEVRFRDTTYGVLAVAVPADDAAELEAARAFLACCAQSLGAGLEVEALRGERKALADEATGNVRLADIGETSGPVAHDFNNFLNALLLHIAVLQIKLPQELHPGLAEVRQQAMGAAGLIQHFQHYRQRRQAPYGPVDLNRAVQAALEGQGGTVHLDVAAGELMVLGTFGDLKRLCTFLFRNAVGAAAGNGGEVRVRTLLAGEKVVLRVEDAGPAMTEEQWAHLFEASATGRDGTSSLELAACKTLVRRLQGVIRGENCSEGGAAFVVEWKPATA